MEEWHGNLLALFSLQVICLCHSNIGFQLLSLNIRLSPLSRQFLKRLHRMSDYFGTWDSFFSCPRYDTVTSPIQPSLQEEHDVLVIEPRVSHDQKAVCVCVWGTLGPCFPWSCWPGLVYKSLSMRHPGKPSWTNPLIGFQSREISPRSKRWMTKRREFLWSIFGGHMAIHPACMCFRARGREYPWLLIHIPSGISQGGHKFLTRSSTCWFWNSWPNLEPAGVEGEAEGGTIYLRIPNQAEEKRHLWRMNPSLNPSSRPPDLADTWSSFIGKLPGTPGEKMI